MNSEKAFLSTLNFTSSFGLLAFTCILLAIRYLYGEKLTLSIVNVKVLKVFTIALCMDSFSERQLFLPLRQTESPNTNFPSTKILL